MTNGEMIQKVFKGCEVCEPIPEEDIIHVIFPDKNDSAIGFDWSWWNMEHKASTTKNDLGVDCISRKALLDELEKWDWQELYLPIHFKENIVDELPSVTPIRPKGHWIDKQHLFGSCSAECSSCHKRSDGFVKDSGFSLEYKYYDFCPNCGAKMVEPQESEDKE